MAFQLGIIQFHGKLGQTIGRKNGNTSITSQVTRSQNIIGVAPSAVYNPKTVKQAAQRLKMRPACNFYRSLGYMLNHSWQGTKYRARSRNRFMQLAMTSSDYIIPFLKKGDNRFVPATYPLSEGALVGADVTAINNGQAVSSLIIQDEFATVGELSQAIYNSNAGFQYGDKLTFVLVFMKGSTYADAQFTPISLQLVLDSADPTTIVDFVADSKLFLSVTSERLQFSVAGDAYRDYTLSAAAIIQSRVPATEDAEWQRSNAALYVADAVLDIFMSASAYNAALASYQANADDINSDWYLNIGTPETRMFSIILAAAPSNLNPAMSGGGTYEQGSEVTVRTSQSVAQGGDNYTFLGWYTEAAGGERLSSSTTYTFIATKNTTLYARYEFEDRP